jgi:hypothetical protein
VKLYTSRYHSKEIAKSDAVAVSISRGMPRWSLPYALGHKVACLAPESRTHNRRLFEESYVAQLERHGLEKIEMQLRLISEKFDGRPLVLLCWEDLSKPGEWCHRRMFAKWYEQRTGNVVAELEGVAAVSTVEQLALF